jgi:hypothetical protein
MPAFGKASQEKLATCDPRLQKVFNEVIKHFDCTVIEGHRGEAAQNKAFAEGKSKLKYPQGKHNKTPSLAADVLPYPIDWNDTNRMRYFAGFVVGIAATMGIKLRWGGDWNQNTELKDNSFNDLPHFEIAD